jgi:molecular chaperone DnaK
MIHEAEKELKEHGDKVPAADKATVEGAVAALKTAVGGEDKEAITAGLNALVQARMKIGEAIYGGQKGGATEADATASAGGGAKAPGDDKVVDADFEEVKDDKKKSA